MCSNNRYEMWKVTRIWHEFKNNVYFIKKLRETRGRPTVTCHWHKKSSKQIKKQQSTNKIAWYKKAETLPNIIHMLTTKSWLNKQLADERNASIIVPLHKKAEKITSNAIYDGLRSNTETIVGKSIWILQAEVNNKPFVLR